MIGTLLSHILTTGGQLAHVLLLAPPPLDPTNLLKDLFTWLVRILGAAGMVFFVIDLFRHIAASPRDLRAAGIDGLIMVILLAVAAKADVLVAWAQAAL